MNRKPYVTKQPANWFLKKQFYALYMLRELTSVPVALYALNLMCGLASFVVSEDAWLNWVNIQTNLWMVFFTFTALAAAFFHTITWFQATPKILKIQLGEKFIPEKVILIAHWIGFTSITITLIAIVAYFS